MTKNDTVQQIRLLSQREALQNDRLRLETSLRELNQQLAELEAAIYLETEQNKQEKNCHFPAPVEQQLFAIPNQ